MKPPSRHGSRYRRYKGHRDTKFEIEGRQQRRVYDRYINYHTPWSQAWFSRQHWDEEHGDD